MAIDHLLQALQEAARSIGPGEAAFVQRYLGTERRLLNVRSGDRDRILRAFVREARQRPAREVLNDIDNLLSSDTFEYVNAGGKLLSLLPGVRQELGFPLLHTWLTSTSGWAECDGICQSLFVSQEVLERRKEWEAGIRSFVDDLSPQVRRASLVLQVKPARDLEYRPLRSLAFETVERLKDERHALITKAVSWLLRSLSVPDAREVLNYLERERATLPALAYRETKKKILTGRK